MQCWWYAGHLAHFNPLLTEQSVQQALKDDPEGARAEWEAEFRADLQTFLDEQLITSAIDYSRPLELPPRSFKYYGFVDPSGGRHDAYTLCIGHKEGDGFVCRCGARSTPSIRSSRGDT